MRPAARVCPKASAAGPRTAALLSAVDRSADRNIGRTLGLGKVAEARGAAGAIALAAERPVAQVAQVAQIFGGVNTLSGYVRRESVSAEFSNRQRAVAAPSCNGRRVSDAC